MTKTFAVLAVLTTLLFASTAGAQVMTMSQMSDTTTITAGFGVACAGGGFTAANSYWRTFDVIGAFPDPDNQGVLLPDIDITSVTFGIEACSPGDLNTVPVTILIYDDPAPDPNLGSPNGTIFTAGLTLLHQQTSEVGAVNQSKVTFPLVDANGQSTVVNYIPGLSRLVVEIRVPNLIALNGQLFPGGNAVGETLDTFLSSANCGFAVPTTYRAITMAPVPIHIEVNYVDPLDPNGPVIRGGSGEGLVMRTAVGAPPLPAPDTGPFRNIKAASAGDLVTIQAIDQNSSFSGLPPVLLAQIFTQGANPISPIPGFPEVHISLSSSPGAVVLYDGPAVGSGFFGATIPPGGLDVSFVTLPGLSGFSATLQWLVLDPAGANPAFANSFFAASEAHIVNFN